jgi:thiosulfate reductase cytochrome b subunit
MALPHLRRHSATVRITHWIVALGFFALLLSGIEILISHPRFYWGEEGNVNTKPLFALPIPASRSIVPTGYGYVLPDQNGWSRSLHFEAAWAVVLTGMYYLLVGLVGGHFRRNLSPMAKLDLGVVFVLFPMTIWTGLAMSPGIASATPWIVTIWGGHQSARTIHFFCTILLVLFVLVHIGMVWVTGFSRLMRAMTIGERSNDE